MRFDLHTNPRQKESIQGYFPYRGPVAPGGSLPRIKLDLTQDEVVNIYLGRYRRLTSGVTAEPVDLADDSELRARFYRSLVNKSLAEISAYWARLVFSGKTRPPHQLNSVEAALQHVATQPGALAYLERSQADRRVRIVFEFGE